MPCYAANILLRSAVGVPWVTKDDAVAGDAIPKYAPDSYFTTDEILTL